MQMVCFLRRLWQCKSRTKTLKKKFVNNTNLYECSLCQPLIGACIASEITSHIEIQVEQLGLLRGYSTIHTFSVLEFQITLYNSFTRIVRPSFSLCLTHSWKIKDSRSFFFLIRCFMNIHGGRNWECMYLQFWFWRIFQKCISRLSDKKMWKSHKRLLNAAFSFQISGCILFKILEQLKI